MSGEQSNELAIRPWAEDDLSLEERLLGDPAMTIYIGGPESPEKIRNRHQRFLLMNDSDTGRMFVIVVGPDKVAAGSVGYWETEFQGQTVWETGWFVLPEFQGQGIASRGMLAVIEHARATGKHRFIHAFPSIENAASNALARKAGFTLQEEMEFEYPPGHMMRCNDWSLDLLPDTPEASAT